MADSIDDRLAIQDVMTRYATGVDTRDLDLFADCFANDVLVSGFGREPMRGRADWMAFVTKALERFGRTQHLIGNHVVQIESDVATMRCYVQATHELAADRSQLLTLWATYHDELRRVDGEWRIFDHRLEPVATQTRSIGAPPSRTGA